MYVGVEIENMPGGQMILPLNYDWLVPLRLDRWTGILSLVSPYPSWRKLRVKLLSPFSHDHAIKKLNGRRAFGLQDLRYGKSINKAFYRCRLAEGN